MRSHGHARLFTSCERWSQGVKQVGEIHGRLLRDGRFWEKREGQIQAPYRSGFLMDGNLKSSWGRQKGKDKLRGQRRCLLELVSVEGDKRSIWDLLDDDQLISSAFFSSRTVAWGGASIQLFTAGSCPSAYWQRAGRLGRKGVCRCWRQIKETFQLPGGQPPSLINISSLFITPFLYLSSSLMAAHKRFAEP